VFHTTCFGLHGHLQVCMIFYFILLKESAFVALSCTCLHFARFHLWGWLNMMYYYLLLLMLLFCFVIVYMFFTYLCFSVAKQNPSGI
jgi:hypothetical protein